MERYSINNRITLLKHILLLLYQKHKLNNSINNLLSNPRQPSFSQYLRNTPSLPRFALTIKLRRTTHSPRGKFPLIIGDRSIDSSRSAPADETARRKCDGSSSFRFYRISLPSPFESALLLSSFPEYLSNISNARRARIISRFGRKVGGEKKSSIHFSWERGKGSSKMDFRGYRSEKQIFVAYFEGNIFMESIIVTNYSFHHPLWISQNTR